MSGNSDTNINPIDDTKRAYDGQRNESHVGENSRDAEKTKTDYQGYGFSEVFIILTKLIFNEIVIEILHKLSHIRCNYINSRT